MAADQGVSLPAARADPDRSRHLPGAIPGAVVSFAPHCTVAEPVHARHRRHLLVCHGRGCVELEPVDDRTPGAFERQGAF